MAQSEYDVNIDIENINEIEKTIFSMKSEIKKMEKLKLEYEKRIFNNCQHDWIRDRDLAPDDYPKLYCKICKLYNDKRLYI